jgi:hypothetical protein
MASVPKPLTREGATKVSSSAYTNAPGSTDEPHDHPRGLPQITEALRGLRYGSVTIVVQDSVIVQIERTEKYRPAKPVHRREPR